MISDLSGLGALTLVCRLWGQPIRMQTPVTAIMNLAAK